MSYRTIFEIITTENNSEDIFDFFSLYRIGIFHIVSVKENTLGNRKFSKIKTFFLNLFQSKKEKKLKKIQLSER